MKRFLLLLGLTLLLPYGYGGIPPRPDPPRLVNDFAGLFTAAQQEELEQRLVAFNDSTSNVICVVTVADLEGYDVAEYAYEIGDQWGVRDKDHNNGIVLLVKPKNETSGEVNIQVGYDLEAAIPDATAKKIIENEMIPHFKENDYYGGVTAAIEVLCPLAAGEISAQKLYHEDGSGVGALFLLVLLFALFIALKKDNRNG